MDPGDGALDDTTPASDQTETADHRGVVAQERSPALGSRIGRYELGEQLGAGGMGMVFRARDPQLKRALAIKLVRPTGGASMHARVLREAEAMAKLRHPGVVPLFDVGTHDGRVYLVMPLLEGGTLGAWLRAAPRPWRDVLDRFVAAGRGLVAAHAAGLVHRDFKPDNVLLGDAGEVQVADFGLARLAADADAPGAVGSGGDSLDLTGTGDLLGTPAYMAPEQLRAEPSDARGDQFSFCVALWEGLYGARPFDVGGHRGAAALSILLEAITEERIAAPPAGTDVPTWLRAVVRRGLRADPAQRWPSMAALLAEIERGRALRRRWPIAVAAASLLLGIGALLLSLRDGGVALAHAPVTLAPEPARYRLEPLTQRGDLTDAVLSTDGSRFALVIGKDVLLRGVAPDAEETLLTTLDREPKNLVWSPDGSHLLALMPSDGTPDGEQTWLIDATSGTHQTLPIHATSGDFVTDNEIVVGSNGSRALSWYRLDSMATPVSTCTLPGEFAELVFANSVQRGELIVAWVYDPVNRGSLLVVTRDCQLRKHLTWPPDGISSWSPGDDGSIYAQARIDGRRHLVQLSLDGTEISRRDSPREEQAFLFDRHGGRNYYLTSVSEILLELRDRAGSTQIVMSSHGSPRFAVSADGERIAVIERSWSSFSGPLRVTTLDKARHRNAPVLTRATHVAWSPDGTRLVIIRDGDRGRELLVHDVTAGTTTPVALGSVVLKPWTRLLWLDDARIAVGGEMTDDDYTWLDTRTGDRGLLVEARDGSVHNLARSPVDGTLAFQRVGRDGSHALWRIRPGHEPEPTSAPPGRLGGDSTGRPDDGLVWTPTGSLLAYDHILGTIDEVDLDTGQRQTVASRSLLPSQRLLGVNPVPGGHLVMTVGQSARQVMVEVPE